MGIKSQKDFFSGLMFVIVGLLFAIGSQKYSMGNGARMGPGYFPQLLGILMAILGSFIVFFALTKATADGEKIGSFAWKPLCYIIAANLLFGILLGGLPSIKLPAMGLIIAIFGTTIVSGMAGEEFKLKEALVLSTVLAIGSYLAFVVLLKLQFPVWPTFITG